jgi:hypothetical protein
MPGTTVPYPLEFRLPMVELMCRFRGVSARDYHVSEGLVPSTPHESNAALHGRIGKIHATGFAVPSLRPDFGRSKC